MTVVVLSLSLATGVLSRLTTGRWRAIGALASILGILAAITIHERTGL